MELNLGHRGATRQSWREKPARNLILELIQSNPKADHAKLVRLCDERLRDDDEYRASAADYIVTNAVNALEAQKVRRQREAPIAKAKVEAETKSMVEAIKHQIIILNLEMPNGQRMRYCTGAQMEKFGGAFGRIGKKVGKTKRVGEVLSEKQVKEIMG